MRRVSIVAAVLATIGPARSTGATCEACCETFATLAGWSADGRAVAVIHRHGDRDLELTVTTPRGERSWASHAADQAECIGEVETLPGAAGRDARLVDVRTWGPLRRYRLEPVDPAWRAAFTDAVEIVRVGRRRFARARFGLEMTLDAPCTAWEVRDRSGRVLATLPRSCDAALPLASLAIRGGYLQPGGSVALVKVRIHRERQVTEERFLRIALR